MIISRIVLGIMAAFMLWGAFDRAILNDRFGYGEKFDEGMNVMGPLATAIAGFMCMAPVLGRTLTAAVSPFFEMIGADPTMFVGSILALDMGGYPLALQMTDDYAMVAFAGGIYASMMGVLITYSIPLMLRLLQPEDMPYMLKGIVCGAVSIPPSCFVGGLLLGLPVKTVLSNLLFVIVVVILLVLGLLLIPGPFMKGFTVFARFLTIVIYAFLAIAILQELTDITVISGMDPIGPQLEVAGGIAITLAGAYPFVHFITKTLRTPMQKVGQKMGINEASVAGLVATLANSLPMLALVKDMNPRGKVAAIAFTVPAGFVLGDHLAYAAANMHKEVIIPLMAAKLLGGVIALFAALLMTRKENVQPD